MTVELIDTEGGESRCSDGEEGEGGAGTATDHPDAFLERFLAPPGSICPETRQRLAEKPVFLCRSVHSYRRRVRHKLVPRQKPEARYGTSVFMLLLIMECKNQGCGSGSKKKKTNVLFTEFVLIFTAAR
jgi:hypothetical protein